MAAEQSPVMDQFGVRRLRGHNGYPWRSKKDQLFLRVAFRQGCDEVESSRVSCDLKRLVATNLQRPFRASKTYGERDPGLRLRLHPGLTSGRRFAANPGWHPIRSRGQRRANIRDPLPKVPKVPNVSEGCETSRLQEKLPLRRLGFAKARS